VGLTTHAAASNGRTAPCENKARISIGRFRWLRAPATNDQGPRTGPLVRRGLRPTEDKRSKCLESDGYQPRLSHGMDGEMSPSRTFPPAAKPVSRTELVCELIGVRCRWIGWRRGDKFSGWCARTESDAFTMRHRGIVSLRPAP
jgi:hypothetical protein